MFMDAGCDIDAGLERLFEAGIELALQIQADAMAAECADERARLAIAFHRVSRSVRQTAALKMKLVRDAALADRQVAAEAEARHDKRLAQRKAAVSAVIERAIETEVDEDEQSDACEDLSVRLETEALDEGFLDEPLDRQIERICEALQLPVPPPARSADSGRWSEGPERDSSAEQSIPSGNAFGTAPPEGKQLEFDAAPPPDPRPSG